MSNVPVVDGESKPPVMKRNEKLALALTFVAGFALRLPLIDGQMIMPVDSLRLAVWEITLRDKALPLYPLLLQAMDLLIGNEQIAGGLVAALLGAWTVVPLYMILSERVDPLAGAIGVVTAMALFHNIAFSVGVVPNPALIVPLLYAWLYWGRLSFSGEMHDLVKFNLACGLAALARPEGWGLVLPLVWANARYLRGKPFAQRSMPLLSAAIPYALLAAWFIAVGQLGYASEFFGYSLPRTSLTQVIARFAGYAAALVGHTSVWPFFVAAAAYPVAAVARVRYRALAAEGFTITFVLLAALSIQWAEDLHRLLTPAVYATIVVAAAALSGVLRCLKRSWILRAAAVGLLALCIIASSVAAYVLFRGIMDDLPGVFEDRLSAWSFAGAQSRDARVLASLPVEASYYGHRRFRPYVAGSVRPGDFIVLHSMDHCIDDELEKLGRTFRLKVRRRYVADRAFKFGPGNVSCSKGSGEGSSPGLHESVVFEVISER